MPLVSKEKLKSKMARQKKISVPQTSGCHESDAICAAHRVYRIKVLMSFMSWSAHFKIEDKILCDTDPSHMHQLVPFVQIVIKEEIMVIKKDHICVSCQKRLNITKL